MNMLLSLTTLNAVAVTEAKSGVVCGDVTPSGFASAVYLAVVLRPVRKKNQWLGHVVRRTAGYHESTGNGMGNSVVSLSG